jgi:hypothetical protein
MVLYAGMPRKLRIEYSGAMYHVMSRGDRREKIYLNDVEFSRSRQKQLFRSGCIREPLAAASRGSCASLDMDAPARLKEMPALDQ